jgi:dTDP-3-amino-2,3,6-trideoxy-4-keto-D-glucose/dTDP-3-amino-3,4,6-trideoxy-alpha-D-glucose/dTDP-2,6-dideoxy-D-kanosamine transaminase
VVPVVDLARRGRDLADAFASIAARVASSGSLLLGDETASLEAQLAEWASVGHAVAVSSGAAALQLALAAVGVTAGDEVIVPAFTAVPTASAVAALGAIPVMVDVRADTAALDIELVEAARTEHTRAAIVVHLYGRPAELPQTDLAVVEDGAQAHGAVRDHTKSSATIYSFYPTKNVGGVGDGGAVVTARADVADSVRLLRAHGMTEQYVHTAVSQNFRMSEIEAAWLRLAMNHLQAGNARRRSIAARYRAAAPHLRWHADHLDHVHHLCVVRAADRQAFRDAMASRGVATAVHYPLALTQQPAYRHLARTPCPQAEAWAAECVTLPCFPELSDDEVEIVAAALADMER